MLIRKHIATLGSFILLMLYRIGIVIQQPLHIYGSQTDVQNWIQFTQRVAISVNPFVTPDPPLRYLPSAIISLLYANLGGHTLSQQVVTTVTISYIALSEYLLLGIAVYMFAYSLSNWITTAFILGIFSFMHYFGVGVNHFLTGSWQYSEAMPVFFLVLTILVHVQKTPTWKRLIIFGFSIGVLGMLETLYAGVIVVSVSIAYLYNRRTRQLVLILAGGILPLTSLLFVDRTGKSIISELSRHSGLTKAWGPSLVINGFNHLFTTPSYIFVLLLLVIAVIGTLSSDNVFPLDLVIIGTVLALLWVSAIILVNPLWWAWFTQEPIQYLALCIGLASIGNHHCTTTTIRLLSSFQ